MNELFEWLAPLAGMVITCATIIALFWIKAMNDRARAAARTDFQNRLIEKFASSSEFVNFVQSTEGQQFLSPSGREPFSERGLSAMKWGIFFGAPGLGFLVLGGMFAEEFAIPGVLLVSVGLGLFTSGFLSNRFGRTRSSVGDNVPQQT
jgi:hypothetical protein